MRRVRVFTTVLTVLVFLPALGARAEFIIFDYPGAQWTTLTGIWEDIVVGMADNHSFLYDGSTFTPIEYPGAANTRVYGISEGKVFGSYKIVDSRYEPTHGFVYDGSTYVTVDWPGAAQTRVTGVSGDTLVGRYSNLLTGDPRNSFVYDGAFSSLHHPSGEVTLISGISGDIIFGSLLSSSFDGQGFLYDGTTWTDLTYENARGRASLWVSDIFGDYVVGSAGAVTPEFIGLPHAFLYDGSTYKFLDKLYAGASGIFGDTVVGWYTRYGDGTNHGFITNLDDFVPDRGLVFIPLPGAVVLGALGLGAAGIRLRRG